jgi:hypothetical protein
MQHNERIIHEPPTIPFRDCPPRVRELLGLAPPNRAAETKDGKLQCTCADPSGG